MPLVDYLRATPEQQTVFREVNPHLGPEWDRYRIYLKADGSAFRIKGWWKWTDAFGARTDAAARAAMRGDDVRSKGDHREFKTCDFHLNREQEPPVRATEIKAMAEWQVRQKHSRSVPVISEIMRETRMADSDPSLATIARQCVSSKQIAALRAVMALWFWEVFPTCDGCDVGCDGCMPFETWRERGA
jgi:hypothetical protein